MMKRVIGVLIVISMVFPYAVVASAEGIAGIENNDLFSVVEEYDSDNAEFTKYEARVKSANPDGYTYDGVFYDGLTRVEDTFADADGKAVTLPEIFSDEKYFKVSEKYDGQVFAGNTVYMCGFILMTDRDKNSGYTALYDKYEEKLYELPKGYEIGSLDSKGIGSLYKVNEGVVEKAYKIELKKYPVVRIVLKNSSIPTDVVPVIENDRALVPVRSAFENLEANVSWDDATNTVTATMDDLVITMTVDSTSAFINGEEALLEVPARIKNGRTLVPLRFVGDCFKVDTAWDAEKRLITLTKGADYYNFCGYEDHGYVSPALSSEDTYPDYLKAEVSESVESIKAHQNEDTVTVAFITDHHYALSHNHDIRMQRTVNAYKDLASQVKIDTVLFGGDYTNEGCKEYKTETYNELRAHFEGVDYLPVNGNHDDGSIWDVSYSKLVPHRNYFTHSELYDLFYDHLPSLGAKFNENVEAESALYYYVDDAENKIRYIAIDSGDVPYITNEEGKLIYQAQWDYAMSQEQLDWLTDEALKFEEEGWSIVFKTQYVHYPSADRAKLNKRRHMTVLMDIIDAYKKGEPIKGEYYENELNVSVDADFSKYTRGEIITVLAGDVHRDKIDCSEAGVPYIFTANAVMYYSGSASAVPRTDGDKSELLFDIITIDKKTGKIYITRVGAGEDRETEYRK